MFDIDQIDRVFSARLCAGSCVIAAGIASRRRQTSQNRNFLLQQPAFGPVQRALMVSRGQGGQEFHIRNFHVLGEKDDEVEVDVHRGGSDRHMPGRFGRRCRQTALSNRACAKPQRRRHRLLRRLPASELLV
nr:hypothetical protein [Xanthomonas oryzae]